MHRPKKWFLFLVILFFLILLYIGYDIASRTRFPGSKSPVETPHT